MAASYQDEMSGGLQVPLTKDNMRKLRSGPSSRSTRSSASRDESDWKHSATTRTSRSSGDEDVTIKVVGATRVKVGGAEIQCDGGELSITSRGMGGSVRGDSDLASSIYIESPQEERRSRVDRIPVRTRTLSQSGSWRAGQSTTHDFYGRPYNF
jgi:hypothetical protein